MHSKKKINIGAYYYPGWHKCHIRDGSFPKQWSEWDLVYNARPGFSGHQQPNLPLWGREDESDPSIFNKKINTALEYGIDFFVFAFFWSRKKRVLEGALNEGFLKAQSNKKVKFALMWANRMPRKVLPVKDAAARLIDPSRLVYTDPNDFLEFVDFISDKYFVKDNYLEIEGSKYLSIFDTTFFIKQMGIENATSAIKQARELLHKKGFQLHLAAIDPIDSHKRIIKEIGFDSSTHYVFLPEWKGQHLQDFNKMATKRSEAWKHYEAETGLPYVPSVSPGWDANPRACDYGKEKEGKYPWSPIIINNTPQTFSNFLKDAIKFAQTLSTFPESTCMISSWNEWSEGHYLEPDLKYKFEWLKAVKLAKKNQD